MTMTLLAGTLYIVILGRTSSQSYANDRTGFGREVEIDGNSLGF